MGFNDKFALQKNPERSLSVWSWLFSNSGRALALPVTDAAVLGTSALYGRRLRAGRLLVSNRDSAKEAVRTLRQKHQRTERPGRCFVSCLCYDC
jgi:hypothetical protein